MGLINASIEQLEEKLLILSGGFTKWFGSCWTALKFSCKDLPTLRDDCGVCINTEGCGARVYQVHHNNGLMRELCQSPSDPHRHELEMFVRISNNLNTRGVTPVIVTIRDTWYHIRSVGALLAAVLCKG